MVRTAFCIATLLMAVGQPLDDPTIMQRGASVLAPFKASLQAELKAGLAEGPRKAIDVCRARAPELAKSAGSDSVRVGRTSHKLRNPSNAPADWMKPLLDHYLAHPEDHAPRAVRINNGHTGYVEPIFMQSKCLICHGESIAPTVRAALDEMYPDDRATGFRDGDFRGLFWVEMAE